MVHAYRQNLFEWARTENIRVRNGSYPRPGASGSTQWWAFEPTRPKAQITFVHGTGDDAFFPFAALLRDLVPRGVTAFLFDLDGHGVNSSTLFDERLVLSCVEDAWRHAQVSLPHHMIGFSLGAALALHALRQQAIDPDSLILLAPPLQLNLSLADLLPEALSLTKSAFWNIEDGNAILDRLPAFGPFGRKRFPIRLSQKRGRGENYTHCIARTINRCHLDQSRGLAAPLLILYGGDDKISKPAPRNVWRQIAKKSRTQTIDDASHFVLPMHPDCIASVVAWLSSECQVF